ncbi:MAG: hypothetical protein ACI9FJ_000339 [Alteromonadaceae bacterium]
MDDYFVRPPGWTGHFQSFVSQISGHTGTLTALAMPPSYNDKTIATPKFKHASTTLAVDAVVLAC